VRYVVLSLGELSKPFFLFLPFFHEEVNGGFRYKISFNFPP
jgi:hypothetical protein